MNLPHAATAATEAHFGTTQVAIQARLHEAVADLIAFTAYRDAMLTQLEQTSIEPPYTVKQAAAALNVSRSTVEQMVHDGRLHRIPDTGRKWLIARATVAHRIGQQ